MSADKSATGGSRSRATHQTADSSQFTHGGKRAGAGGPKLLDRPVRRTVYLDQKHVDLISKWNSQNRLTFSQSLRQILDLAADRYDDVD